MALQAGPWDVSRREYHADRACLCNSALKDFRASVPLYYGRHVTREIERVEPTAEMNLGTALHVMCLEPHRFNLDIAVAPPCDRRTKAGREQWEAFESAVHDRTIITEEQNERCEAMAAAILGHSRARSVLRLPGECERAIRWQDEDTGLWVRNLLDKWIPSVAIVADIKTAKDPTPAAFAKSVVNFGYHCQAALYSAGAFAVYGVAVEFVFVVVGSEPPHEVACYQLDADAMQLGHDLNVSAMREIRRRHDADDWRSRHADVVEEISLPRWAFTQV